MALRRALISGIGLPDLPVRTQVSPSVSLLVTKVFRG
jgi:hypothetical protein